MPRAVAGAVAPISGLLPTTLASSSATNTALETRKLTKHAHSSSPALSKQSAKAANSNGHGKNTNFSEAHPSQLPGKKPTIGSNDQSAIPAVPLRNRAFRLPAFPSNDLPNLGVDTSLPAAISVLGKLALAVHLHEPAYFV